MMPWPEMAYDSEKAGSYFPNLVLIPSEREKSSWERRLDASLGCLPPIRMSSERIYCEIQYEVLVEM